VNPSQRTSLYTELVSHLLFPMQEWLKQHDSVALRRQMEQSQWWTATQLQSLQLQRLKALLHRAQQHVPYYQNLFTEIDFHSDQVNSLTDLRRLPLLNKAQIRQHCESFKADDTCGLTRFNTGGSSGEPLIFFIGKERVSHDVAAKWRATRWWGVDIGDPEIVVWGSPIELGTQDKIKIWRDRIFRTRLLPAFDMSETKIDGFLAQIRRTRPAMLFGYPSVLSHLATRARSRGLPMNDLGIRVAFVTSERLYDEQRQQISQTYGCSVANGYGGRDAGFIAHECPHGSMHITAEDIIVEILDEKGEQVPAGTSGEIVITHLATGDFPFIRYRTGDIGTLSEKACACGRGLPVLQEVEGRSTDFVIAQDGTVMHGLALIYILRDMPEVRSFKIEQESLDFTKVLIVPEKPLNEVCYKKIREGFQARLGKNVNIEIIEVATIFPEKSGKYRYVVSKIASR